MKGPRRVVLLLFTGSLLLQLAWIISLPPFRGIDEFDHAYRAAAVAHGQWIADYQTPVPDGRGNLVEASRSLVEAARPECYFYVYTGYANCNPVSKAGHGYVTVASAAARYNPVFYWIVGTPAKLFRGAASLEVMRLVASLLCSALIAGIGWILTRWATSPWPLVGLFVGLTPTVMYTSMLPAPNGVEMLGGFGLWAALLGLTRVAGDAVRERTLIRAAVVMAIPLVFVRSLGPLWLAMIVLTMAFYLGWRRVSEMLRRSPKTWANSAAVVIAASLLGLGWTITSGTNSPTSGDLGHYKHPLLNSSKQIVLWPFQSFAAFPTRTELAPLFVYMLGFVVLFVVLAVTFRLADAHTRRLIWIVVIFSILVPWLITLNTYSDLGGVWQGRYTLPYALGLPLIATLPLDSRAPRGRFVRPLLGVGGLAYLIAHASGIVHVLVHERQVSPLTGTNEWWIPPEWLIVALVATGVMAWWEACAGRAVGDFLSLNSGGSKVDENHSNQTPVQAMG